jgi:ComF family protein
MEEPIAQNLFTLQLLKKQMRQIFDMVVDTVAPPKCLDCGGSVGVGAALCLGCWQNLHFIEEPVCDALGTPFAYDEGEGALSAAAIADPPPWAKARAAVAFDEHGKKLVHLLKYRDRQEAGLAMARMMAGAGRKLVAGSDVIMPVPLHKHRLWQRRFNQSAFLAQHIARASGKTWCHDVLLRMRPTRQQVGLSAAERHKNVRRAFVVPLEERAKIEGKTVLLIDDVRTTGATVGACATVLLEAGAKQVYVLTYALVLEPSTLETDA